MAVTPEMAYDKGRHLLTLVRETIALKLLSPTTNNIANKEITRLEHEKLPKLKIGLLGATGAGKSSTMNSLVFHRANVLAIGDSGSACSAVPTSLSAHAEPEPDAQYKATVHFYSKEYLENEILTLKQDFEDVGSLTQDDRKVAWAKVRALYPQITAEDIVSMSVQDIIASDPNITQYLGKNHVITANDAETFSKKIAPFIQSASAIESAALWAAIEYVELLCPSPVLLTGAILVDLPGIDDADPARDLIAREWRSQCDHIFVVADISRAVGSKTAQVLLGETFKTQLMLDGKYNSNNITFIATKNDNMDPTNLRALALENDPELQEIERVINNLEEGASYASRNVEDAVETAEALGSHVADLRRFHDNLESLTRGLQNSLPTIGDKRKLVAGYAKSIEKRRKTGTETDFRNVEEFTTNTLSDHASSMKLHALSVIFSYNKMKLDEVNQRHLAAERNTHKMLKALGMAQKQLLDAEVLRWRLCSKKRGENTVLALRQQFREGLANMEDGRSADAKNYDQIKLPVHIVSARQFIKKFSNARSQGELLANLDVEDTGIPALERHIHSLTGPARQKAVKSFLDRLLNLARRMSLALGEASEFPMLDRECFRKIFNNKVAVCLREGFNKSVDAYVQMLQIRMDETLGADCRAAAQHAATMAPGISQLFAEIHYATYRAALRRGGRFRQDLNANLTQPFSRKIMRAWLTYFEGDLAEGLEGSIIDNLNQSLGHLEGSAPAYLTRHVLALTSKIRSEVDIDIKQLSQDARNTMGTQQRISSLVESHVRNEMQTAYNRALEEKGHGMDKRQKDVVHRHIADHKETIFDGAADILVDSLKCTSVRVGRELKESVEYLSEKIEDLLSSLWEENRSKKGFHDPEFVQARQDMDKIVVEIEKLLQMASQWEQ